MRAQDAGKLPARIDVATIFGLAWPIMVSMLSRTAMTTADTLFVGRLGTQHLAAIGLAGVASFLGIAFGMGLLGGVNVAVAHRTGAQDHDGARRLWWQALYVSGGLSLVVGAAFWVGPWIFPILGASESATELASSWFSLRMLGSPLAFGTFALTAWFQGRGDTRTPMVAVVLANALNIALDPVLIFGLGGAPELGIAGAAHATNLAQAVGLGFLIWRSQGQRAAWVSPNRLELREIWRLGSPLAVWFGLDVLAFGLFVSLLARVGEAELAAHVVVLRIMSVSFLPGHAVGEAGGVLVGQALGAGRPELARQAWRSAARLGIGVMAFFAFVFLALPELLLAPFELAPEVQLVATGLMIIGAFFQVFDALAMTALGALKGAGDTRFTMWVGVASSWLVKLPLGAGLAIGVGLGAAGAWLGLTVDIIVLAVLATWRIVSGRWLPSHQEDQAPEALPAAAK